MANIEQEWNHKKIKAIVDYFGHPFFQNKKVLDLGCKHGDAGGGALYRLGSQITAVDAREEHLKIAAKKYPGIKTIKSDLDCDWAFSHFDLVINTDLLCHLKNWEGHFRNMLNSTNNVVLETAVCDSLDPNLCSVLSENKDNPDWSFNGFSARPTAAFIEKIFGELSFDFKRLDSSGLNTGPLQYDWIVSNTGTCDINKRRFWFARRNTEHTKPQPIIKTIDNSVHARSKSLESKLTQHIVPIDTTSHPSLTPNQAPMNIRDPREVYHPWVKIDPPSYRNPFIETNQTVFAGKKKFVIVIPSY